MASDPGFDIPYQREDEVDSSSLSFDDDSPVTPLLHSKHGRGGRAGYGSRESYRGLQRRSFQLQSDAWLDHVGTQFQTVNPIEMDRTPIHQRLRCELVFLGCTQSFDSLEAWHLHCRSHFYEVSPHLLQCPFRNCFCIVGQEVSEGSTVWDERFLHICNTHRFLGEVDDDVRHNPHLINLCWESGLISLEQRETLLELGRLPEGTVVHDLAKPSEGRYDDSRGRPILDGSHREKSVSDKNPKFGDLTSQSSDFPSYPDSLDPHDLLRKGESLRPNPNMRLNNQHADESFAGMDALPPNRVPLISVIGDVNELIDEAIDSGSIADISAILDSHFTDVIAVTSWQWLTELVELGYSNVEIAELLVDQRRETPWISYEPWLDEDLIPDPHFHIEGCVHVEPASSQGPFLDTDRPLPDAFTLRKSVASLCGLAGFRPNGDADWNGAAQTSTKGQASVAYGGNHVDLMSLPSTLRRIKKAFKALCSALALLQQYNACCNSFTIIENIADEQDNVKLKTIEIKAIMQLGDLINGDFGSYEWVMKCHTQAVGLLPDVPAGRFHDVFKGAAIQDCLHIYALTSQYLCLGLVAYCQAHIGPISQFFNEQELAEVQLLGSPGDTDLGPGIRVDLQRLTCLDSMLRSAVLVFRWDLEPSSIPLPRKDLCTDAIALIDTWGPGSFTKYSTDTGNSIRWISIRGGRIHCPRAEASSQTRCLHWSDTDIKSEDLNTFDPRRSIRIGAWIEVNPECLHDEQACLEDFQDQLLPLGTSRPSWRQKERQAGVQGGQYVNLTFNVTWEKHPGMSLKEHLIERLRHGLDLLCFLESPCGLRVSFCSGFAHRVKMRALVAELMPAYIRRRYMQTNEWEAIESRYELSKALLSGDLQTTLRVMSSSDPGYLGLFHELVLDIITSLKATGLDSTGELFVVGFMPSDAAESMRSMAFSASGTQFWTQALKDSDTCATFAYFTLACLQISGYGCRCTKDQQQPRKQISMLQTEVHRQISGHWVRAIPTAATWTLRDGEVYHIGSRTRDPRSILFARVIRPKETADPQLLVQKSKIPLKFLERLLRRQTDQHYIQERLSFAGRSHRAFITSIENREIALS